MKPTTQIFCLVIGLVLFMVGLWGGAWLLNSLPAYQTPSFVTGLCVVALGFLIFYYGLTKGKTE